MLLIVCFDGGLVLLHGGVAGHSATSLSAMLRANRSNSLVAVAAYSYAAGGMLSMLLSHQLSLIWCAAAMDASRP